MANPVHCSETSSTPATFFHGNIFLLAIKGLILEIKLFDYDKHNKYLRQIAILLRILVNEDLCSFWLGLRLLVRVLIPSALCANTTPCCLVFLGMHYIDCSWFRMQLPGSWLTLRLIIMPGLASFLRLPITFSRDYEMLLLTYKAWTNTYSPQQHPGFYSVFLLVNLLEKQSLLRCCAFSLRSKTLRVLCVKWHMGRFSHLWVHSSDGDLFVRSVHCQCRTSCWRKQRGGWKPHHHSCFIINIAIYLVLCI